uniref:B box-type domain-containing protein n=1 Tax=Oncorhynchus tshawytscha TaxID=74940 RepID=A0A8C8LZ81_ONCTS
VYCWLTEDMSEGCQALPLLDSQAIVCDLCTEDRKPARKTCIKCEMSMCAQHLEPHLSVPFLLQTHTLTEPIAPGARGVGLATKCPHHGKILEYYCLDDLTSVCMSCAIEDQHRIHNMKTLPKAHKELREKLKEEQKALAKRENQSLKLRRWDKEQRERLASSSIRLIEGVSALLDITLKSVQSSAALSEGDSFHFLQGYEGVHQAVEKARAPLLPARVVDIYQHEPLLPARVVDIYQHEPLLPARVVDIYQHEPLLPARVVDIPRHKQKTCVSLILCFYIWHTFIKSGCIHQYIYSIQIFKIH